MLDFDELKDSKVKSFLNDYLLVEKQIEDLNQNIRDFTDSIPLSVAEKLKEIDKLLESIPNTIANNLDEKYTSLNEILNSLVDRSSNISEQILQETLKELETLKTRILAEISIEIKKEMSKHKQKSNSFLSFLLGASCSVAVVAVVALLLNFNFKNDDSQSRNLRAFIEAKNYVLDNVSKTEREKFNKLFNEGGDKYLRENP